MVFSLLKLNLDVSDETFNYVYPERIRKLAKKHWTCVEAAKQASEFLAERPGTRVLDIGSGVGKFCMVGACHTRGFFVGVEQRLELVEISNEIASSYDIPNVKFIHANITSIQFRDYEAFYFYNAFFENVVSSGHIDDTVKRNLQVFDYYSLYTFEQFSGLPSGTRIVTYCTSSEIIPRSFKLIYSLRGGLLKFWEKVR